MPAGTAAGKTVWLCKPGQRPDPCTPGLSTTVYSPSLTALKVEHPRAGGQAPRHRLLLRLSHRQRPEDAEREGVDPIFPSHPFAPGSTISIGIAVLGLKQPMPATVFSAEPGSYSA